MRILLALLVASVTFIAGWMANALMRSDLERRLHGNLVDAYWQGRKDERMR